MKRSAIKPGNKIVLSNGTVEIVYHVNDKLYIAPKGSHYLFMTLEGLCDEDLQPMFNCARIVEIRDTMDNVVWVRPVEMTVTEIERALSLTPGTLRIKK